MATRATGKYSLAISDRSGQAFPYREMVKEWTGAFVHISEFEPKHPQLDPRNPGADGVALMNARPQNFTILSGGGGRATVDLTLPGDFAFITAQPGASLTTSGVVISTMIPANPSLQNRRRELLMNINSVTVEIS